MEEITKCVDDSDWGGVANESSIVVAGGKPAGFGNKIQTILFKTRIDCKLTVAEGKG